MRRLFLIVLSVLLLAPATWKTVTAGTRDCVNFQGMLFNANGNVIDGVTTMTFGLYGEPTEGAPLWEETQAVDVLGGVYTVALGFIVPLEDSLFDNDSLYLGLQIEGDREMTPRLELSAVPWAKQAEVALTAMSLDDDAVDSSKIANGAVRDTDISSAAAIAWTKISKSGALPADVGAAAAAHFHAAGEITSGELADARVADTITIGASGAVNDAALSANVTKLGSSIESSEITDGTIADADIGASAGIAGTKIGPNFGAQNVTTSGNIATSGSGTITAAGDIAAAGGFKTMIGPFQETNVSANTVKVWELIEGLGPDEIPMPWAGSVMGVAVACIPGTGVTAGTLTVEPTIDGAETNLEAVLTSASGSNKRKAASQAKDTDTFGAGQPIGCKASSSLDLLPLTLDCTCLVFVEM